MNSTTLEVANVTGDCDDCCDDDDDDDNNNNNNNNNKKYLSLRTRTLKNNSLTPDTLIARYTAM
jgi:hypothetical protein